MQDRDSELLSEALSKVYIKEGSLEADEHRSDLVCHGNCFWFWGFHRLAINGQTPESNQPFFIKNCRLISTADYA
jgi:hypothetical protein